jgi:hypothetical protein
LGAKGAGEGGTAAAGAAIANAVSDALGAEVTALPLKPERVMELARQGEAISAGRAGRPKARGGARRGRALARRR